MKGVIDIGAHYFEEYDSWRKAGAQNFLLFEPVQSNYDYIRANYPFITCHKLALGNQTGQIKMYIDNNHKCLSASIYEPEQHYVDYPEILFDTEEIVDIDKLDNIEYNRDLYDHIHLTAQGAELEILKGAEKSLKYIRTIKSQVFRKQLYRDSFVTDQMIDYLYGIGFDLVIIEKCGISWDYANFKQR